MKILARLAFICLLVAFSANQTIAQKSKKPLVVFVAGDHEYGGEQTLPLVAAELEKNYGFRTKVIKSYPNQNAEKDIPGLEALDEADLAVFFLRWRQLPPDQLAHIEKYMKAGKPMMAFRTTTHAFNYPKGHESADWNAFAEKAFGAPPGWGGKANHTHCGHECSTDVSIVAAAAKNPLLRGVEPTFHVRSWLYKVQPDYPAAGAEWLLMGKAVNPNKADFPDNPVAWTWKNTYGGNIFLTTMGHPEDFRVESFQRLVINAIHWGAGKKIPKKWKGKMDIQVPYRGIVQ